MATAGTHLEDVSTLHVEAETHAEVAAPAHTPTLFAEPILGSAITNSLLTTWTVVVIIIGISLSIRFSLKKIPTGIQNFFEIILEGALSLADSVTGDRTKTLKFFPIVFALFIFVLISNWLGLLPGIGSVGTNEIHDGHNVFIPFFRGGTADLNTTLALSLFAVVGSHIVGVVMAGSWNHLNKFVNLKALIEIPRKVTSDPTIVLVNPIKVFVGLIEIIGEVAKVASLSFRLFGNIFAGEVLLASMAAIFAFLLPIPFMFLEVLVGVIQALIFAMLTLVYFTIASSAEEH
jgi:F-type H+-transporting ATPase subunit a